MKLFWKYCPLKFAWTLHNIIGHPFSEIVALCGLKQLSNNIHDLTLPPKDHKGWEESRG